MATVQHPTYGLIQVPDEYTEADVNNLLIRMDAEFGEQYGIGETLYRAAERGITSTARGIEQMATGEIEQGLGTDTTDLEKERELRIMMEQNPVSAYTALFGSSLADPVTAPFLWTKLINLPNKVASITARGAGGGFTGGFLEPTYEEFGDSRVMNVMFGTGLGAGLGAVVGKALQRAETGPSVKLEGDEDGVIIPEKIRRDGKLKDEVLQSLEDVDLAAIEARVGKSLRESGQIEDVQKQAGKVFDEIARPLADVPTPRTRQFDPVAKLREEFQAKIQPIGAKLKETPNKELARLTRELESVKKQKTVAQQFLNGRGTALSKVKPQKTFDLASAAETKISKQIADIKEAKRYSAYLRDLDSGQISKLPKREQAKLNQYTKDAGLALKSFKENAQPIPEQTQAVLPRDVEELAQQLNAKAKQVKTPTTGRLPSSQPTIEPVAREQLGLDPRTSAGSMGTRPSARYEAITKEGVVDDAAIEAVRRTQTEGRSKVEIPGASPAENKFYSRLRDMTAEQMVRLKNQEYGYYSWANVQEEGLRIQQRILKDYNDLNEWFIEKASKNEALSPQELEAIFPLIQEAEQRILDNRAILASLIRAGDARSEEAVRLNDEILLYNYLTQAFDAQGTLASNVMTQMKRWKRLHTKHEKQLKAGKEVNDLLGVVC